MAEAEDIEQLAGEFSQISRRRTSATTGHVRRLARSMTEQGCLFEGAAGKPS